MCGHRICPSAGLMFSHPPRITPPARPADLAMIDGLTRFAPNIANFVGLPAITVPIGRVPSTYAANKATAPLLPVGLHLLAPAWHEASLLHAAAVLEAAVAAAGNEGAVQQVPRAPVWWDLLR